jgi:hypothetical protein
MDLREGVRPGGTEMVAHGPSGVPSRTGVRLGDEAERP